MRSPSPRVLDNEANIFNSIPGRDAEGGVQFPYPSIPTYADEPCSVQPQGYGESDGDDRITQVTDYLIIFGRFVQVSPRDMITYTDNAGVLRTLFVAAIRDDATRGAAFSVRAVEKI